MYFMDYLLNLQNILLTALPFGYNRGIIKLRKGIKGMKILTVSDHEASYIWDHFDPERFKDIDLIISCGDLKADYLSFLVTMIKAPLFYVHGNHDGSYINAPPEGCTCIDDRLISFKGVRILGFGGTQNYNGGHFQYTERQMSRRVNRHFFNLLHNKGFDILVTHAPAYGLDDGKDLCHKGFKCFNSLLDKHKPRYFLHGHQHLNYHERKRVNQYKSSTIINAYEYYIFEYEKQL